jgi:hypothetical protein
MFRVTGSTSTKTGLRPHWTTGQTEVAQETAGNKTSSPGIKREARLGFVNADKARRFADDPELTMTAYGTPSRLQDKV